MRRMEMTFRKTAWKLNHKVAVICWRAADASYIHIKDGTVLVHVNEQD
jgi:hypothetical protein